MGKCFRCSGTGRAKAFAATEYLGGEVNGIWVDGGECPLCGGTGEYKPKLGEPFEIACLSCHGSGWKYAHWHKDVSLDEKFKRCVLVEPCDACKGMGRMLVRAIIGDYRRL